MCSEKQIEEMAHILCGTENTCNNCMFNKVNCYERLDAEELYNAGYRKASEIFEEIGEAIMQSNEISDIRMKELAPHTYEVMREAGKLYYTAILNAIDELKKKYTEEGK